jgi:hypothetical protein
MNGRLSALMKGVGATVAALSLAVCSGCSERISVNERMLLRTGETLVPQGGGCTWMELPAGAAELSPGPGDIAVAEGPDRDVFVVRVFSDEQLLASREYSSAVLEAGQLDEFSVTTRSGAVYVLRYWGGSCADLDASSP